MMNCDDVSRRWGAAIGEGRPGLYTGSGSIQEQRRIQAGGKCRIAGTNNAALTLDLVVWLMSLRLSLRLADEPPSSPEMVHRSAVTPGSACSADFTYP